jgi:putative phosphoribosyl transferase
MDPLPFADRTAAGRVLADALLARRLIEPVVVLALPRGGVPVAAVVARTLHAPLDLLIVRKIGAPGQPELAVAAVAEGEPPEVAVDEPIRVALGVSRETIDRQARLELREVARRRERYLAGRAPVPVAGATVVLVDDGIATGTTVRAALRALRRRAPARVILAVPVAPSDTLDALRGEVDEVVCLATPEGFSAVGCHYVDFHQVADAQVLDALASVDAPPARVPPRPAHG